jgi:polar amino acid transport system substrate-binding protein
MDSMKRIIAVLAIVLMGVAGYGLDIRTMYQDIAPKFMIKDGVLSGLVIDIMAGMEKADPTIHFVSSTKDFTPMARIENSLESGTIDAFFGLTGNPERAVKFNLAFALFQTSNVFIAKADDDAAFKTLAEFKAMVKDSPVLAVGGTAQAQYLQKQGFKIDDGAKTTAQAMEKLLIGRGRFVFLSDLSAYALIKEQGLGAKVKVFPTVTGKDDQFLAFSKKTPQSTVDTAVAALAKMKKSGELDAIIARYLTAK